MLYQFSVALRLYRRWWLKSGLLVLSWLLTACVMPDGSVITSWSQLVTKAEVQGSSPAETLEAEPLRVVTIEPVEVATQPADWELALPFSKTTLCGDGQIWLTPNYMFDDS